MPTTEKKSGIYRSRKRISAKVGERVMMNLACRYYMQILNKRAGAIIGTAMAIADNAKPGIAGTMSVDEKMIKRLRRQAAQFLDDMKPKGEDDD